MPSLYVVILLVAIAAIFVEGATELVCKSLIFDGFRKWVSKLHPFLAELIRCGYCTSVWVAIFPAAFLSYIVSPSIWYVFPVWLVALVVVHRLSNYLHCFCDKHLDKFYDKRLKGK